MTSQVDARFIGGTGRSGTSLLGDLLDAHPDVVYFHEPRFISDAGGLCDFVEGKVNAAEFERKFLRHFRRFLVRGLKARGHETGQRYSQQEINRLLPILSNKKRITSARWFIENLFFGVWIEKTPHSVRKVGTLYKMFPDLRYVHVIREPKDVWASVRTKGWGPRNVREFALWYKRIMADAWREKLDGSQYLVVSLEKLVAESAATLNAVLQFFQIDFDADQLSEMMDVMGNAHVGRWKKELDGEEIAVIDAACGKQYRRWKRLEAR